MKSVTTTRRELYPDARDDRPLRVFLPPRTFRNARIWHYLIATVASVCGFILWITDGGIGGIPGMILWGGLVLSGVVYVTLRLTLNGLGRRSRRVEWSEWGVARGFRPASDLEDRIRRSHLPVFSDGRDRDWQYPLLGGRIGQFEAVVGATAWTTGSGKSQERHHVFFVCAQLPPDVATVFPGSSCTRFLRGITDVDLDVEGQELRLESTLLDNTCEIRVADHDEEDLTWRQLFDPITIEGLANTYDIQWQHIGDLVACCAGGSYHSKAPEETLDTLCMGTAWLCGRMLEAAR